jgi:hypothetical protein
VKGATQAQTNQFCAGDGNTGNTSGGRNRVVISGGWTGMPVFRLMPENTGLWPYSIRQGRHVTLETIFYISQIPASAAVVGSLIYVGLQVRYAERSQRGLIQQARAERPAGRPDELPPRILCCRRGR